ncbi:MAG: aminotransferase class V-fold PLP-dependent enzyme [Bacillota bacterium]|nr:aminotransferase class V-fold PLP-dependent enzyme [Bacillota bacterium]
MINNHNLYFDNASTSWPKPEAVYRAAENYMRNAFGNPGRSGHTRTLESDRLIYNTRVAICELFKIPDPSRVVFALNATDALNIAIKGILEAGDHVLFTAMEHNSVLRPLGRLRNEQLITTTMVPCSPEGYPDLNSLEASYMSNTRLLIVNHASNVTGTIIPLKEMIESAHKRNIPVLVDAAQSAGTLNLDVSADDIDLLAFTGHKSLLGPTGTGGLYVKKGIELKPLREGGTGSQSESDLHPESMPERLEAGTLNSSGLSGLLEGIRFIDEIGIEKIRDHEVMIRSYMVEKLKKLDGLNIYGPEDSGLCSPVLSITIDNADCGEVGFILESSYGILCRTGLHCAPLAHQAIGTFPEGTIRLSPGYFTSKEDVDYLAGALKDIISLSTKS